MLLIYLFTIVPLSFYVNYAYPISGIAPESPLDMPMPVIMTLGVMAFLGLGPGEYYTGGIAPGSWPGPGMGMAADATRLDAARYKPIPRRRVE